MPTRRPRRPRLLTQSEYAKRRGCSRQHISALVASGVIRLNARGLIDPVKADADIAANLAHPPSEPDNETEHTFAVWRKRRERAKALLSELELQQNRAEVIECAKVKALLEKVFITFKARCLALPRKLAPLLLSMQTPQAVEAVLTNEIHELLRELSTLRVETLTQDRK